MFYVQNIFFTVFCFWSFCAIERSLCRSTEISPGTEFMQKLSDCIVNHIKINEIYKMSKKMGPPQKKLYYLILDLLIDFH